LAAALMCAGCSTTGLQPVASQAGTHDWFSPFGNGRLELREDWSFTLSLPGEPGSEPLRITGTWREDTGQWSPDVTLLVRDVQPSTDETSGWIHAGTEIMLIFGKDSATYLGLNGVVEVYWGM